MCIGVYVCTFTFVCIDVCVHMCIYIGVYVDVCMCLCMCVLKTMRESGVIVKKITTLSFYILREFKMALKLEQSGLHLKVFNLITFAYSAFSLFGKSGYRIHQEKKHSLHETFAERMKTKL